MDRYPVTPFIVYSFTPTQYFIYCNPCSVQLIDFFCVSLSPQAGWAEPEPSQATDMALACCFPGQSLRGRLPLLSPTFKHSNLRRQVPPRLHDARDPSSEVWHYGREYYLVYLTEMTTSTPFWDLLHAEKTTWDRRLYFPSEGRRAENFFASAGFEPANSDTRGQHAYPQTTEGC